MCAPKPVPAPNHNGATGAVCYQRAALAGCKDRELYHFYASYKPDPPAPEQSIKQVDMGIAFSRFHQKALEQGLSSTPCGPDVHYVRSWKAEKEI